jgi:hypothetical protein
MQNHSTLFCFKTKSPRPNLPDCQLAQILCLEPPGSISEESPFRFSPGKLIFLLMKFSSFNFFSAPFIRSLSSLLLNVESPLKVVVTRLKSGAHQCSGLVRNISHRSGILNYYPEPGSQLIRTRNRILPGPFCGY